MRKIALDHEQMKELADLGLDTNDASMYWHEMLGVGWFLFALKDDETYEKIKSGREEKYIAPAYTLSDILENHLYNIPGYLCCLDECSVWIEDLDGNIEEEVYHHGEPTINSVFKILCYCLKKGLICTRQES